MNEHSQRFYDFGPFVVDVGKRLLLRANEPVPLAPKVLETLLALIENRERVLSKDELLTLVWGDTVVEEGGLTRNVSMLRKALGEKPEDHQYIVTVPARGYRFVAEVRERWRNGDAATTDVPAPLKPDGSLWVRSARRWIGLGLAALILGFLTYVVLRPARVPALDPLATVRTRTSGAGVPSSGESQATFRSSPQTPGAPLRPPWFFREGP